MSRRNRAARVLAIAALVVPTLLGLGTEARAQFARWTIDKAAAERGQQTFVASCAFCHGSDARGSQRAPDLIQSELVNKDDRGELIGDLLTKGRQDKGMPAFPALAGQAADIANFLHGRIGAVMNRFAYKIDLGATGDARAGERYFNGPGGCGECHSPAGDLAHVATRYKPDQLLGAIAFPGPSTLYYVGVNMRPVSRPPIALTVRLPSGREYSGTAIHIGEFDVSLRDADGVFRSFDRTAEIKVDIKDPLDGHRRMLSRYRDADLHNLLAYLMELK